MASKYWLGDMVKCKDKVTPFREGTIVNLTWIPNINTFEYEVELPNGSRLFKYEEKLARVIKK